MERRRKKPRSTGRVRSAGKSARKPALGNSVADQLRATQEILRLMRQSPASAQPVFDAIVQSAAEMIGARGALLVRYDGAMLHAAAVHPDTSDAWTELRKVYPRTATRDFSIGLAILDRTVHNIGDVMTDPRVHSSGRAYAATRGYRAVLQMPLVNDNSAIGAIGIIRDEPGRFSDGEVALIQSFADQAVIAIENVRLFTELAARNSELTESLEQQTSTSEVLAVISRSPESLDPVFDVILDSAVRLCEATHASLFLVHDGVIRHVAARGTVQGVASIGSVVPMTLGSAVGRVIIPGRTHHVDDAWQGLDTLEPEVRQFVVSQGVRSVLGVPLLRDGGALGAILIRRTEVRPFSDKQVRLLETFAAQAVIAIENVRLFTELKHKNAALTDAHVEISGALMRQTATSEILRVISSSPTDAQPVFAAIAESAATVCGADNATVFRFDGELIHFAAHHAWSPAELEALQRVFPISPGRGSMTARAILTGAVAHVADIADDPEFTFTPLVQAGFHTVLSVPMLRSGEPIGAISIGRREIRPFLDPQIALLQTFADQAVIAIENVRLFTELQQKNEALTRAHTHVTEALEQQTATGEILRVISRAQTDLQPVFDAIAIHAARLCVADLSGVLLVENGQLVTRGNHGFTEELLRYYPRPVDTSSINGRAVVEGRIIHVPDVDQPSAPRSLVRGVAAATRFRSQLSVPMFHAGGVIGVIVAARYEPGPFTDPQVELVKTFADQAVIAIENVRLFTEVEQRTAQLQVANRHKDEFLANMSHELRTPLNGIIGFSEVMLERMFGEINAKQEEYLTDILASGRHLLSLINDILDLSKIEAGRMELDLTDFDVPTAIDNALMLMRERAARRGQVLERAVDPRVGTVRGDERKFKQVLLNLLSNAVKFTPDGGRVGVGAVLANGDVAVSVTDTGIGIAPEHHEVVFEEFRQVGHADKKAEGTGLGLALCRKFVELHGGRISVTSEVGKGSAFTFTLPVGGPALLANGPDGA